MEFIAGLLALLVKLVLHHPIGANYTVALAIHPQEFSGSSALNYILLFGSLGHSHLTEINRLPNGDVDTDLLQTGRVAILRNMFLEDYGFIYQITVGNMGESLTLKEIFILDHLRDHWVNISIDDQRGYVDTNSSANFSFPVNGNWNSWAEWTRCSVTCGLGSRRRTRYCNSPSPAGNGRHCTHCTFMINGTCSSSDSETSHCSIKPCLDAKGYADSLIADALSLINGNKTLSVKETMKLAFNMVDSLRSFLGNQISNSSVPVMLDAGPVAIGLLNLAANTNTTNLAMSSADKGTIILDSRSNTSGGIVTFSALNSSLFFRGASKRDTSSAVISLSISNITASSNLSLHVSLPNLNRETESESLDPVHIPSNTQLIRSIQYDSPYTFCKISMDLWNVTDFVILFSLSSVLPNSSSGADASIHISNNTMNMTNQRCRISPSWDSTNKFLRISIPPEQVLPDATLSVIMFASPNLSEDGLWLRIAVTSITPRNWNSNLNVWEDIKVEVDEASDITNAHFKSDFLGTFSAKIFIAPNKIDFRRIFANFSTSLANSYIVLLTIVISAGLFILLALWMWRKDRRENILLRYEPLLDNDPTHQCVYVIRVHTGCCRDSGTSSHVSISIMGEQGSTGNRSLIDGSRTEIFETGSVSNLVMATESTLGNIVAIRVSHNSSAPRPSWYLEKIIIEDIETHMMYIFMCESWLSATRSDGRTERVLVEIARDQNFQNLFYRIKVPGVMDRHVLFSLTSNSGLCCYSRVQKVSVLLTTFALLMVSNAMFFGRDRNLDGEANFSFNVGLICLTWFQIYTGIISIMIAYPGTMLVSAIFRRTSRWNQRWTEAKEAKMKRQFQLPKWFIFVGWLILLVELFTATFFTFLYSLEWGADKSKEWFGTFLVGIFGVLFLLDPVVLLLTYIVTRKVCGAVPQGEEANIEAYGTDNGIETMFGGDTQRQIHRDLTRIKKDIENARKLSGTIVDCLTYCLSLLLLTCLSYSARDPDAFRQTETIRARFVTTYSDIYPWALGILEEAYPTKLYNGLNRTGEMESAIAICDCLRQGPFRLRQIRVKNGTCGVSSVMSRALGRVGCNEDYNMFSESTDSYNASWQPLSNGNVSEHDQVGKSSSPSPSQSLMDAFLYQNAAISLGYPFEGRFGYYGGGGYAAELGMTNNEATLVIQNLEKTHWLDRLTRAVFLEGTVYNTNTNLFTTIQVLLEQPNSGGVFLFPYGVRSFRLYDYLPGNVILLLSLQIGFVLVVALSIWRESKKIMKEKSSYFSSSWNRVEMLSIFLSLCTISCTATRVVMTINTVATLKTKKGSYVSFDRASSWSEISCILMGISLFVSTIRVLKYLGFNKYISIMQGTIVKAYSELGCLSLMFLCFLVAFVTSGHILFSPHNVLFSDLLTMVITLFGVSTSIITYDGMFESPANWDSGCYYVVWSALSMVFIASIYVAILNDTYSQILKEANYKYDRELVEYFWKRFEEMRISITASIRNSVPWPLKRKMMEDMDHVALGLISDREGLQRKVNPAVGRLVADLNGEEYHEELEEHEGDRGDGFCSTSRSRSNLESDKPSSTYSKFPRSCPWRSHGLSSHKGNVSGNNSSIWPQRRPRPSDQCHADAKIRNVQEGAVHRTPSHRKGVQTVCCMTRQDRGMVLPPGEADDSMI